MCPLSARVLVVDDVAANRKLLEAKLSHEYFQVATACNGEEAVSMTASFQPDIILLDVMMPVMDGFEACRILKGSRATEHIPVVMVTALSDREHRLAGLEAGADDFLTKPVDDFCLMSRVRALTKYKLIVDELRTREANAERLGVLDVGMDAGNGGPARILIVDDNPRHARRLALALQDDHIPLTMEEAAAEGGPTGLDLVITSLGATSFDPLKLCAHFRSSKATRDLPILCIADMDEEDKAIRALELGAGDIIMRPIDTEELAARVRTQVRKKRYLDLMRRRLDDGLEMAITDQLTGLFNRRHMMNQLGQFVKRVQFGGQGLSVFIADIDYFKQVNDTYGHEAGDQVLKEFAQRIRQNVRPGDVPCRQGGEEFAVIMPETPGDMAGTIAERLRRNIASAPFRLPNGTSINVTVSVGVATARSSGETVDNLLKRADDGLYQAKQQGRNQVIAKAA